MFYLEIDKDIFLRTLHPDDAERLFQLIEDNRERLVPWIHPSALPENRVAARKFTIECFLNSMDDRQAMRMQYRDFLQELDYYFPPLNPPLEMGIHVNAKLSGEIMIARAPEDPSMVEFGYWISREKEGQGIIIRSVSALMDYAIEHMDTERFLIGCAVENSRSRAIPERLGYQLMRIVPGGEVVGKYVYDRAIYEISSRQWRERT
jgi:ribosomal-protein-serine acetyltransferase